MKKAIHILLIFTLLSRMTFAQVKFEATISKDKVGLNESIEVVFETNIDEDSFIPPNFENFEIVSGPNQTINNTWVKGEKTFKKTITFYLLAQKEGTFTIEEAELTFEDEIIKTEPLKIKVSDAYKSKERDPFILKFNEEVHLDQEISTTVGTLEDTFDVSYILYVSPDIGINNWDVVELPKYLGFDVNTIEIENLKVENGTYKDEPYRLVVLKKTVLQPKQKGTLIIAPFKLRVTAEVPSVNKDLFGGMVMRPITKTLKTKEVLITVN